LLRLPPFRYLRAASVEEAAAMLAGEGTGEGASGEPAAETVRLVAGGTDLWPNLKRRHQKARTVVSLMGIPGLDAIDGNGTGEVRIGATALLDTVERDPRIAARFPAFRRAVASISSPPLRRMGTLGGNLCVDTRCTYYNQTEEWRRSISYCMKAEGEICWVAPGSHRCLAHAASDAAPMLMALGARVRLAAAAGERAIPLEDLYQDDGILYLAKRPDEILAEVLLPAEAAADRCRASFWKLRRRGSIDFAVLSAAVALWTDAAGAVERARIVLGAVGARPGAARAAGRGTRGRGVAPGRAAHARGHRPRRAPRQEGGDAVRQHRLPGAVARGHGRALRRRRARRGGGARSGEDAARAPDVRSAGLDCRWRLRGRLTRSVPSGGRFVRRRTTDRARRRTGWSAGTGWRAGNTRDASSVTRLRARMTGTLRRSAQTRDGVTRPVRRVTRHSGRLTRDRDDPARSSDPNTRRYRRLGPGSGDRGTGYWLAEPG
jgi:4-hydroxybenzoyl-CoA reductase subunit beta